MSYRLDWARDGKDWPHCAASRFVRAGGLTWHVQQLGNGPALLLVHGTGASSHSWRDLAADLAQRFTLIIPDLPGHAFSETPPSHRLSLPAMAKALAQLLAIINIRPEVAVGHSAGAAILARMVLDETITPVALISINGAFLPFNGATGHFFSGIARLLISNPLVPRMVAWRADGSLIKRLITDTGSRLSEDGLRFYELLMSSPAHVAAVLGMMAHWDLKPLAAQLPALDIPLTLLVGENDKTVLPREAEKVARLVPRAKIVTLPGLGHLAHEEQPANAAELIIRIARVAGIVRPQMAVKSRVTA